MTRMFNPLHPGLTLHDDVLPALGLGVTQAAEQLGVSHVTLSRMLSGRAAISPDMALRSEAPLGIDRGGDARVWLAEQNVYDVWQAAQQFKIAAMAAQTWRVKACYETFPNDLRQLRECGKLAWPTEFTHMHRGRPGQTVLYLSERQPIRPRESLLNRCLVFIKRRLRLVGPAPEKMTHDIPTWLLRKDTEQ